MTMPPPAPHSLSYPAPPPSPPPPSSGTEARPARNVLIYFISGNPGLIDYYQPFFEALRHLLDSSAAATSPRGDTRFHIYGQDLAGFGDDDHEPFTSAQPPRDLAYQIDYSFKTLCGLRVPEGGEAEREGSGGQPYDEILVAGHSVGSYIALELFHKLLLLRRQGVGRDPTQNQDQDQDQDQHRHLNLRAGFLLFPTVEYINRSTAGARLDLLRRTPLLGPGAHLVAQGFLRLWPRAALRWLVGAVLGFPPHAADVTSRFLKSRDGVWQALHLGMDEMRVIGEDRWDEELWEVSREVAIADADAEADATTEGQGQGEGKPAEQQKQQQPPKFFFFFGRSDHWVASHLRDAFIERRTKQVERTRFMIDEGDLPHAFCINHSETVAEKVFSWINELYQQ
ncbi:hypothetical protein BX600DRAFT_440987 [Xylariales sp. PMI_506]|nr:hypothetical protein BX600DRAFT_440987 [Xylariales sp. PMI_506]